MDPRNVTLEPEFYADCDDARFQPVKPLLWPVLAQCLDLQPALESLRSSAA